MTTELVVDRNYFAGANRSIAVWLMSVAALVFLMIVVGGATRLTDSGLSITEWKPIMGAIPPMSEADWESAFEKYKEIPEYQRVNKGMTLEAFKFIYWWEWSHRFLGRLIGLAFALPLAFFWWRGDIRGEMRAKLIGVLGLGAVQGAIGWYMVSSGLVDRVDVSQYRLALHLGVAFVILGALVWLALDYWPREHGAPRGRITPGQAMMAPVLAGAVLLQVLLGALVAGLKAGAYYNTWPDMDGEWLPSRLGELAPWHMNLFENVTTVQFNHRMMAYVVAILAIRNLLLFPQDEESAGRRTARLLAMAVMVQVALGIWTLLTGVPLSLGLVHQAGAAIVLVLAVWHWHTLRGIAAVAAASAGPHAD
jgi:cytochrome c oxidase assembly protein subunit 15